MARAITPDVNQTVTLLASAARTTTQTSADLYNDHGRGIVVVLDMTVVGTGSVTLSIDGKIGSKYVNLLTGAAVTTNSTNIYRVYPGLSAVANATANDFLPALFRITVTANNANPATYSVNYHLIK